MDGVKTMGQALKFCTRCENKRGCDLCADMHEWIMERLDAEKVVKCKECLYYEKGKSYEPYCNHPTHGIPYPNENDFCSYGERKDGGVESEN